MSLLISSKYLISGVNLLQLHMSKNHRKKNWRGSEVLAAAMWTVCFLEVDPLSITPCRRGNASDRPLSLPFTDGYVVVFEQRLNESPFESDICN